MTEWSDGEPTRLVRLMKAAVSDLRLDLGGITVLTEAGTGSYASTPVLAALAGSTKVYALTSDSPFGSTTDVRQQVHRLADAAGVRRDRISLLTDRTSVPPDIDVVTNLGFVRPIDRHILELLSPVGVVSLMYEAWELRREDVDIDACREMNVPVAGVWEDFNGLNVFQACGVLAVKICFEAGLEVAGNRLVVLSPDRFGAAVAAALRANLADVRLVMSADRLHEQHLEGIDGVIVADYLSDKPIVHQSAHVLGELAIASPGCTFVQFAGALPLDRLAALGFRVYPGKPLAPHHMMFTLAHVGPRPVVYLRAAGLKVGQLLWRKRAHGEPFGPYATLVQNVEGQS
jgi:hypothetical protein